MQTSNIIVLVFTILIYVGFYKVLRVLHSNGRNTKSGKNNMEGQPPVDAASMQQQIGNMSNWQLKPVSYKQTGAASYQQAAASNKQTGAASYQQAGAASDKQTGAAAYQQAGSASYQQNSPQTEDSGKEQEIGESSTLEYLNEKARQDEAEHAKEKWEETIRLNKNYGGHRVAERFLEGELIPKGKKCVLCDYCGAENLVPMMPREHYSCYFCREQLK